MKIAVLLMLLMTNVYAKSFAYATCLENLLQGNPNSNVFKIERNKGIKSDIYEFMMNKECSTTFSKKFIKLDPNIGIWYFKNDLGYFIVNKDYNDDYNVIFTRWD